MEKRSDFTFGEILGLGVLVGFTLLLAYFMWIDFHEDFGASRNHDDCMHTRIGAFVKGLVIDAPEESSEVAQPPSRLSTPGLAGAKRADDSFFNDEPAISYSPGIDTGIATLPRKLEWSVPEEGSLEIVLSAHELKALQSWTEHTKFEPGDTLVLGRKDSYLVFWLEGTPGN